MLVKDIKRAVRKAKKIVCSTNLSDDYSTFVYISRSQALLILTDFDDDTELENVNAQDDTVYLGSS